MGAWEFFAWFSLWAAIGAEIGTPEPIIPVFLTPMEFMVAWVALGAWALLMCWFKPKKP